jgi:hypothetical protein
MVWAEALASNEHVIRKAFIMKLYRSAALFLNYSTEKTL